MNLLLQCHCQRIIFNQFCKSPLRYQKYVKSVCSNTFGDDDEDIGIEVVQSNFEKMTKIIERKFPSNHFC